MRRVRRACGWLRGRAARGVSSNFIAVADVKLFEEMWMRLRPWLMAGLAAAAMAQQPAEYTVPPGTKMPLSLINTISTKHSAEGDRVYLETSFPVLANGR